jgi:hypothetical protein
MKRVLSIGLLGFVLFSCKPQTEVTEEETTSPVTTYLNSDEPTEELVEEAPETQEVVKEVRYWSASETKLPQGVVYTMDCSNRGTAEQKLKDNYVTIKRTNGFLTIVKDIDDDLFLNLQDGDIID